MSQGAQAFDIHNAAFRFWATRADVELWAEKSLWHKTCRVEKNGFWRREPKARRAKPLPRGSQRQSLTMQ